MTVHITKVLDGKLEDVEGGKYNIFIPISLGNLFFTRERVRELVQWALAHTKESVSILVADKIQAINYEVLRGLSEEESRKTARENGDNFVRMAERVVRSLPTEQQSLVTVVRWEDIEHDEFIEMQQILRDEYKSNQQFRAEIHRVVTDALGEKVPTEDAAVSRLGDYVIEEMPLMFKGITVNEKHYDVFLYPGLSQLDVLVSDIQSRRRFPEIADRLSLTEKQPMIEAYVE